jgi:hypothetical protein
MGPYDILGTLGAGGMPIATLLNWKPTDGG